MIVIFLYKKITKYQATNWEMIFRLLFLSGIGHRTLVLLFIENLKYRP